MGQFRTAAPILATALFLAAVQCRKSAPDEIVYTGRKQGGSRPAPIATTPPSVDPGPGTSFAKDKLLAAIADCTIDRARAFETQAQVLRDAMRAYEADAIPTNATAAQDAWRQAMAAWQEVELFRFGPAASPPHRGAASIRDRIYSWPHVDRCVVDEQIVSQVYRTVDFASSLVNGRGLAASEYLIFSASEENACSQFKDINAQGTWRALGNEERARRRIAYATAIAEDVLGQAHALVAAWIPEGQNFKNDVALAGTGTSIYPAQQDAFNAINDALFYVENEVKDLKVGHPLGLFQCFSPPCAADVESPLAHVSSANVAANLVGFRRLFQGCGEGFAGLGFDDWLREAGASDLADRMRSALEGAQAAADGLDAPIEDVLAREPAKVQQLHDALRALTDPLKTEFVTDLNLELPRSSEGDND